MSLFRRFLPPLAGVIGIAWLVATGPTTLWAQEGEGPTMISVRLVDVRSDSLAEWQAAAADISAAFAAAGQPFFHVYERLRGPNLPAFSVITLDAEFNDVPPVEIDASVIDRILRSQNDSELLVLAMDPAVGVPSVSVATSGEFMSVRVRTVAPSNRQAYYDWQLNELTPAARAGGVTDLRSGRVVLGGNSDTFVRFYFGDSVQTAPAGGGNLAEALGQAEFQHLIENEADLILTDEMYVYRYREDLSYTADE